MLLYFCLLLLSSSAFALKYNVVAIGSQSAAVRINGVDYPLTRKWPDVGYYKGEVATATANDTYKYVVDGVEEPFDRDWSVCKPRSTYNDFFMRQETIKKFEPMGYPFAEKQQWERNSGPRGVFNDDYINTVVFTGGQEITNWFMAVANKTERKGMSLVMINRDAETYQTDVELNIEDTSQLKPKMKFDFTANWEGRNGYKLRPSAADPVFIRDKLYNDVLEAVGCPHGESGFTRVYVNDVPLGLYNLQESPSSKDFIKTQFYGAGEYLTKRPTEVGSFVDASTGADFAPDAVIGAFKPGKGMTNAGITLLINELARLDPANTADYDNFHQRWFDTDYFFRPLALQYLSAHYDSYWFMTTNFVVYNEILEDTPNAKKFYFVDQDFDQTYGVNLAPIYNPYGAEYPRQPYSVYVNANWTVVPYDAPKRTMVDKLLANVDYKNKFEAILQTLVEKIFNPVQMNRHIDQLIARIRPEVEWDYNLGASRAHQGRPEDPLAVTIRWTMADFDNGLTQSVGGNWGLKTYIQERSEFVRQQFTLTFQDPPLIAATSACTVGDNNATDTETTGTPSSGNPQTTLTGITGTLNDESSASSIAASVVALVAFLAALL